MGRVFLVDAGTNGGEISGTAKTLNSVDARPTKYIIWLKKWKFFQHKNFCGKNFKVTILSN